QRKNLPRLQRGELHVRADGLRGTGGAAVGARGGGTKLHGHRRGHAVGGAVDAVRSLPATDVGILRRHRRRPGEPVRPDHRIQTFRALPASILVLRRMKKLLALLLILIAPVAQAVQTVDIVIRNGTLVTMAGPNIDHGGVAIDKGRIVAVGDVSGYSGRTTIDATGDAVVPGFVNTHTHAAMVLFRGIADDRDLMDWLTHYIFPAEARNVTADFVKWGTRLAAAEMIASGTTTFTDMYYFEDEVAAETKRAGLRGVLGETLIDFPAPDNKTWDAAVAYIRTFVKKWQGDPLITPALAPHAAYTVSREHLQQTRKLADELHAPILIHVSETRDELRQIAEKQNGMTPGLYLDSIGFLGHDVVAAHGVWLTPEEIRLFAQKGVGIAHCPESNMMLASGIAP